MVGAALSVSAIHYYAFGLVLAGQRRSHHRRVQVAGPHTRQVNAFLGHVEAIYHSLYVNHIFAAVISSSSRSSSFRSWRTVRADGGLPHAQRQHHPGHWAGACVRACLILLLGHC